MATLRSSVFTIGHSNHSFEKFAALLEKHRITAICDVRSSPYSRFSPQFNREILADSLRKKRVAYVFLGYELGARCEDPDCYVQGKVQFDRLAKSPMFQQGLDRVLKGVQEFTVALMCAEKDPLECHRTILVARYLDGLQVIVEHILEDGSLETHENALKRLLRQLHLPEQDLFHSKAEMIDEAYKTQSQRIAYVKKDESLEETKAMESISK